MTENLRTARGGMGVVDLNFWMLENKRRNVPPWETAKIPLSLPTEMEIGPGLLTRVNFDQWIVDCPFCNSAELADPEDPRFWCINCFNAEAGGRWIAVQWPSERLLIEEALAVRPEPDFRHWDPAMSVADLWERNKEPFHHSWTAPRTWVASAILTAAQLNTHVRDNLLETAVAKVTTAGDIAQATGANALARLAAVAYRMARGNAAGNALEYVASLNLAQAPLFNAASTVNNGTSPTDIVTQAITTHGGIVIILAEVNTHELKTVASTAGGEGYIFRDTTQLVFRRGRTGANLNGDCNIPLIYMETPAAGTYTYRIKSGYTSLNTSGTPTADASILMLELAP